MTEASWIYFNDRLVPAGEARVSVTDRGFRYGDGLFETLEITRGRFFRFGEHWKRLENSAAFLGIPLPMDAAAAEAACRELAERNGFERAAIRIAVSRGPGDRKLLPPAAPEPTFAIEAFAEPPVTPAMLERGWRVVLASLRQNADSPLPRHKTLNRVDRILARIEAETAGADEAVFLNTRGEIAEGTVTSLFWTGGGILFTPSLDCNILPGVTRAAILECAREAGLPVEEGAYPPDSPGDADEMMLTSSLLGIVPVTSFDGRPVADGRPGPTASRLRELYLRRVSETK